MASITIVEPSVMVRCITLATRPRGQRKDTIISPSGHAVDTPSTQAHTKGMNSTVGVS
jgi:hypothetical protein